MQGRSDQRNVCGDTKTAPRRVIVLELGRNRRPRTGAYQKKRWGEKRRTMRHTVPYDVHPCMPSVPLWKFQVELIVLDELLLATEKHKLIKCLLWGKILSRSHWRAAPSWRVLVFHFPDFEDSRAGMRWIFVVLRLARGPRRLGNYPRTLMFGGRYQNVLGQTKIYPFKECWLGLTAHIHYKIRTALSLWYYLWSKISYFMI